MSAHVAGRPAAFFDRDGVINVDHGYVGSIDRFEFMPGAAEALRLCGQAGFLVFIVTNQSGVARGYFGEQAVTALHDHMRERLAVEGARIDDIRYCPHHRDGVIAAYALDCGCRKPEAGMILELAAQWSVDLSRSFLVGDRPGDLAAAQSAGIAGHLFPGGDLADFIRPLVANAAVAS